MTDAERVSKLLSDPEVQDRVRREVAERAIREHRAAGVPLVCSRDGKVVLVDPETLEELSEAATAEWMRRV